AEAAIEETTEARKVLDSLGTPPSGSTQEVREIAQEAELGSLLGAQQLDQIRQFAVLCMRLSRYLGKCRDIAPGIAGYGAGIQDLSPLQDQIRLKLENMLRSLRSIFSESFVSNRNGHYTLPVKKEHKNKVPGTVIDASSTGATVFIEPSAISRLREELETLRIEEENEEKMILYTLSAMVADSAEAIRINLEYMEELDFIFAKGKLSVSMKASRPKLNTERRIRLVNGRHPLLPIQNSVPLNIEFGGLIKGVIITGPNTGGKTVAMKTVGLLSVMAQCGLHVPCEEADLAMNAGFFCDIGDGQSISENLSTFSAHMKNVIRILEQTEEESLVLLDELGSGTDPAEGMGLAVAVLEELRGRGCLFMVTTHYPEVKEYGERTEGVINARMAFDRESLRPLYRLELGESGESCAFYIAKRLGMPQRILNRAEKAAYGTVAGKTSKRPPEKTDPKPPQKAAASRIRPKRTEPDTGEKRRQRQTQIGKKFALGDSVMVYPQKKLGIVFAPANDKGEVGVQIQKRKIFVSHRRLRLHVSAEKMYPPDYDFSILFDTVENRKARHAMERKHVPGLEIRHEE
ncbi:MAG TPA: DNA mismatch repair protein MutS, partial [Candidatus Eisenbergiella intestinigallinarum]|nr:DNA mismatch repair protein MutS [Candidatus Eisenbergiella intestinigallinarum]